MFWMVFESVVALLGVAALIVGRFPWIRNRVVEGGAGRAVGCLLLLPLIVGTGGALAFRFVLEDQAFTEDRDLTPDEVQGLSWTSQGLHITATVAAAALLILIAANNAKPPRLEKAAGDDAGRGPRLPDAALRDRPAERPPDDRITG